MANRVEFTPLNKTIPYTDLNTGGIIEELTLADVEAIEKLGITEEEIVRAIKEWDKKPYEVLNNGLISHYIHKESGDKRYLTTYKDNNFKYYASLGLTFEFYTKMVDSVVEHFRNLMKEQTDPKHANSFGIMIELIKRDLLSLGGKPSTLKINVKI